jgi:hypothetical protein
MNPIPLYEQTGTTGNSNIEEICAICLDNINTSPTYTLGECNHKFHSTCLIQSLRVNIGCPLCRGRTDNNNFRRTDGIIFRHILSFCKSKKNTCKQLKTIVKKYEKIRDKNNKILKEFRIFKNTHKDIFKKSRELRTKKWRSHFNLLKIKKSIMLIPIQPINKRR